MGFFSARPHFEDRQVVQRMGELVNLSGQTNFDLGGYNSYIYDSYEDFLNGVSGATFLSLPFSAATDPISGWSNQTIFQPGIVRITPPHAVFFSGNTNVITGTTQIDVTNYIATSLDSKGTIVWRPYGDTGSTLVPLIFNQSTTEPNTGIQPSFGSNTLSSGSTYSSVLGGKQNTISASTNATIAGGQRNSITNGTLSTIAGGSGNTITHINTHIIGSNITSVSANTTHVEGLNIGTVGNGTPINNLGIDSNGTVVVGSDNTGTTLTLDAYFDAGSSTSITWDVSGNSTNYEITITGSTTLNLSNVRDGDYGSIWVEQGNSSGDTITFGTVNGAAATHVVSNGGAGSPTLTTGLGSLDILTFTYNGNNGKVGWSVGNDYT